MLRRLALILAILLALTGCMPLSLLRVPANIVATENTSTAASSEAAALPSASTRAAERPASAAFAPNLDQPVEDDDFSRYVSEKILSGQLIINIAELRSALNVSALTDLEIMTKASFLVYQNPQLLTIPAGAIIPPDGQNLAYVSHLTPDAIAIRRNALAAAVGGMLSGVDWQALSDYEKSLRIHDRIVDRVTYNYDAFLVLEQMEGAPDMDQADIDETGTAYGALVNGSAVCTGYAQAYNLLAHLVGLPAIYVEGAVLTSGEWIDHAWNLVQIDGEWLFVDTTWDDSTTRPHNWFHLPIAYGHINRQPRFEALPEEYRHLSSQSTAGTWFAKHDRLITLDTAIDTLSEWIKSGEQTAAFLLGPAEPADVQRVIDAFYATFGSENVGIYYEDLWITVVNNRAAAVD